MKIMTAIILVAALLALTNAQGMAEAPPAVPAMPADFQSSKISKPDPAVPADINLLLGEWEGVWTARPRPGAMPIQVRRAKMIVYEVTPTKVKYLWGVGFNPETKAEAKWVKFESDLKERGGKKIFGHEGPYGHRMETRTTEFFLEDGVLMGAVGWASIEMKRLK
jgi:hypothetical protein